MHPRGSVYGQPGPRSMCPGKGGGNSGIAQGRNSPLRQLGLARVRQDTGTSLSTARVQGLGLLLLRWLLWFLLS